MNIVKQGLSIVLLGLIQTMPAADAAVTSDLQKTIRNATFEVVRKKPAPDPLQYEKPLPLELLPYMERTDAYQSIGTAFALGNNVYVTAAHVLIAGVDSQYGPPALRANNGNVYNIARVLKFSAARDFAAFSLASDPTTAGLPINRSAQTDDPVLAVGNALGDGVVIREGLLTSQTAEEQDGRWKWLRFSAAASPGNSGGPLLDTEGKVIGVVIAKSANENLNYSLPISEVLDTADGVADFDQRLVSGFPVLRKTRTYAYKEQFKLPLDWREFAKAYQQVITKHGELARSELMREFDARLFPKGSGTEGVLFDIDPSYFPRLIVEQADDTWSASTPNYQQADLPGDGFVSVGTVANNAITLLRLHRSENATNEEFYADSKGFMDTALKALAISRSVGSDNVRVTSLGPAVVDTLHTDRYGRRWQQRVWPLPYMDAFIVGMLLPTPDGYAALLQYAPATLLAGVQLQSAALVDFIDVSYWGTTKQWQAFLQRRQLLPDALKQMKQESGENFTLRTKRFEFIVPNSVLPLSDQSQLGVGMGFMRNAGVVTWDTGAVWLYRDNQQKSYVGWWRQPQPPTSARLELRNKFDNLRNRRSPYDMQVSREQDNAYVISGTVDAPGKTAGKITPDLVYGLTLALEGTPNVTDLAGKQRQLLDDMHVLEQGEAPEVTAVNMAQVNTADAPSSIDEAKLKAAQMILKSADELSTFAGQDSRGKTLSDDVHTYLLPLIDQYSDQNSWSDAVRAQRYMESLRRFEALQAYWRNVPRLTTNRSLWPKFLQLNQLPPDTPHDAQVTALETSLKNALEGIPRDIWAEQAIALTKAYLIERYTMAQQLGRTPASYVVRQSTCPSPSGRNSGTERPTFDGEVGSLTEYYPADSIRHAEEGLVVINVLIDERGCATQAGIVVSSGSESLDKAALRWVEGVRFLPGAKLGKPIAGTATIPVNFKLEE